MAKVWCGEDRHRPARGMPWALGQGRPWAARNTGVAGRAPRDAAGRHTLTVRRRRGERPIPARGRPAPVERAGVVRLPLPAGATQQGPEGKDQLDEVDDVLAVVGVLEAG